MPVPAIPTPTPALGFPAWYRGGNVDIEVLLMGWFQELLTGVTVLTYFPPDKEVLEAVQTGASYLRMFRSGGRIVQDGHKSIDQTHMQFAAMSASRDLSWEIIEFVRQMLYTFYPDGARIQTATLYAVITCNGEMVGPSMTPEAFRDPRLVPVTFELQTERRKGLPSLSEYGAELGH